MKVGTLLESNDLARDLIEGQELTTALLNKEINLDVFPIATWIEKLKLMLLIRLVEQKIADERRNGVIGGPVHLSSGQEAIAVGISTHLSNKDYVFSAHRSHAHLLALDQDLRKLFAEILGKSTGSSRGMGGSMHLWSGSTGFHGSVPIVAGTVSLAVGAGLASRLRNQDSIAVTFFGDGAMEEGVVHESLNLAKKLGSPTLFVCENNFFSSHMHISQRQPSPLNSRFAVSNLIDYELVDGNNISDVISASASLISKIRETHEPAFLEAITFRHFGHVDWREDTDVGVHRSASEIQIWKTRDPISRLEDALRKSGNLTDRTVSELRQEIENLIHEAWQNSLNDPFPSPSATLDYVYGRPQQKEQSN